MRGTLEMTSSDADMVGRGHVVTASSGRPCPFDTRGANATPFPITQGAQAARPVVSL